MRLADDVFRGVTFVLDAFDDVTLDEWRDDGDGDLEDKGDARYLFEVLVDWRRGGGEVDGGVGGVTCDVCDTCSLQMLKMLLNRNLSLRWWP